MMSSQKPWWYKGVIYQIYPRSFCDSNNDGIGDLNGITSKLDYLQDLGVDALWLSPIYPSPDVDFGYDVSDYQTIDPKFGTMQDFDRLVEQARKRGLHIILDLVLNHTSDQHPWFIEAKKSIDNPFHDYYLWRDPKSDGSLPNNWQSVFGGKGWEFVSGVNRYYYHMFYKEQPDVNWRNPNVRQYMLDVFKFWLDRGVQGFRLDVFNLYFKDPDFKDNPVDRIGIRKFETQTHVNDLDQPEMIPFLQELRRLLDKYPESYAVGETFNSSPEKAAKYCAPGLLHAAFNFSMLGWHWKPARFLTAIQNWEQALDEQSWANYVMSNHDTKRPGTRYTRNEKDDRLKIVAAMLLTLRGTPFMYYGDEIGMRDIRVLRKEIQDPIGKRYWPFPVGRDGCRSPMQWNDGLFAGFSEHEPWLKIHPNYLRRNSASQKKDPTSLINFYRRLIHLRKEHPVLIDGMFLSLTPDPLSVLAYLRQNIDEAILVILNFHRSKVKFFMGKELLHRKWELLLSNHRQVLSPTDRDFIQLFGNEALILREHQK